MRRMTGGEAIIRALQSHGVNLVFGIPGTHNLPMYRHLAGSGIRHVTPRHEQGAGYAADGYARVSGRPGVCFVTTGPGVINVATATATAYADSIPMLVISPSVPTDVEGRDTGFLHESKDQGGAMQALAGWSHRATSPEDAVAAIDRAFAEFASGRPRPVHVDVPLDVLDAETNGGAAGSTGVGSPGAVRSAGTRPADGVGSPGSARPAPDPGDVDRAASLLARAERPALILGGGARNASAEATRLAERLGAPVVTTVNGKGVVSERHPLSLGASIRLPAAQRWLKERDVVLAVGTELGESDLWHAPPLELDGTLIRVDIDDGQLDKNARGDVHVQGDAAAVLAALAPSTAARGEDLTGLRAAIAADARADGAEWIPLMDALATALGDDGILCGDSVMAAYFGAVHFLPLTGPSRFAYPTGYATLGYGLPAAIGAKLAAPDRRVVSLIGDGGLLFTVSELVTAAELGLSIPVVVPNNGGYGEIRRQMLHAEIEPVGVDLHVPDLARVGEALGGRGRRVRDASELPSALDEALAAPGPTLIELPC